MMTHMDAFWMVLSDNSHETRMRHTSFDLAQKEAKRLAATCRGVKFFVLECKGAALVSEPVNWIEAEIELPF